MADSLRRAGIKLKAAMAMNRRSHGVNLRSGEQSFSRRCYLLELPTELLLEIISYLSVLPEACLALTCKRLFAISGAVLDAKSLHFNRDFAPLFHHYRNGHSFATTRWQLVKTLEDTRWRACSKCLKLHPRSFFPPRELRRKSDDRTCNLGSLAGVVDLCPCKKITFRDKTELVELLKIRRKSVAILASQFGDVAGERFCWHSCTENYGATQLKIEIYPELDDEDQLKIRTDYHLTTTSGQLGKEEHMTARFGCAHRSVDLWLSGVCQTTICQLYENRCASCRRIAICNSCNAMLRCPRKQPSWLDQDSGTSTYSFWTERCLGGASPTPDLLWAAQRIHPAEALVDLDNCSELCPWTIHCSSLDESHPCPGAMSYPPSHNGQYSPQYLQQHHNLHPPQQTIQPQLLYNNVNAVNANASASAPAYQYGKPAAFPQVMIPTYDNYGQTYPPQQHQPQIQQQAPQPAPPPPPPQHAPPQYVNPSDIFQQPLLPSQAPSSFSTHRPSQYGAQSAPPATGITHHTPTPTTTSTPIQPTPTPTPAQAPAYNTMPSAEQSNHQIQSRPLQPAPTQQPQKKPKTVAATTPIAATPPAPSPKPVQVLIPALSSDVQQKIQRAPSKKQTQKQPTQQPGQKPVKPGIDYQVLLLAMADEYLNAAHVKGTTVALIRRDMELEEYYRLVATGLGCLEAVLKNWRLQPRVEALVRLRYARILFEETDNDLEAETALSKGIDLCERNRMLDLKYSMQHLLARMLYKTNPKAALKAVDGMIQDVEAYRHFAWEYAFRFLRVSLSLSSPVHQETTAALQHLHKISNMASRNGDKAVSAMSALIEALAHLQQVSSSDSIEQAQRAIAVARSHQLNDELRHIPQLTTLVQIVDICCSLLEYDIVQSSQKLKVLQDLMDARLGDSIWRPDGSFPIPLSGKSAGPSSIDTGDILQVQNGTLFLSFSWLPQHDLYALCYFLSSITLSCKNSYDGRKAEKFLQEGVRMLRGNFQSPQEITESLVSANRRVEWRRTLFCNLLIQQVFLACGRTDWDLASRTLRELQQEAQALEDNYLGAIQCLMQYAAGTIAQARGDLDGALAAFQSPILSLSSTFSKTARNDPHRDVAILAAINTVLILRDPLHPSHSDLPNLLSALDSFCRASPSKYIQAAYYLLCATVQTDSTIQTKQYLQQALQSATAIGNSQITCMTLTFMSWKYFRGVVGEQAEKSARAGQVMAKKASDRLWGSVTDEILADTLERQGKREEANGVREEGHRIMMGLPSALRRSTS
ncbi:cohesin loading factor-domain-containing protein [Aspergillus pseudoustus]|uniref:Cohesin loading factor-domain-containing protein n=1 Tax=Aspergillus pseudoustus TaxID=1810923 RepID=A0ABR4KT80_9EURO